ncbi:NADPH-dependent 1-acyldihydroxyacetone phosphate reductase [Lachnellula hyalina]|uniref:NADPH-dependent 1-acyldihydroxyacetone phosphate reductase n=1 Tax=Lachnellula hyalina TaxID=1316788 RepID=A0A8H8R594_9HELO|nr:NADPH-dependent 1-acyldihydroxyacetone phosphate reductase [Lachnellula hyalina]TVY27965.1 NADPH-dependent 1-acyldihydroxyacetone phosphate reductase [Lachnellula hyalina]
MSAANGRKSVLITGCAPGGIGNAMAREFHSKGLHVIATARNLGQITDLSEMGMSTLALDVTDSASIEAAKVDVEALTGGGLDILVNNAGRNLTLPALDVPLDEARHTFETNFFSIIALTQTFTPLLISSSPSLILNIGSVAAIVPYAFGSVYGASKAALHSWSNTLRVELEPYGVRVMVVVTGGVRSRIARTHRELPEGSLYMDVEKEFQRRLTHSQEGAMDAGVYAERVVREALRECPKKWFWEGNRARLIRMFGLVRLKRLVMGAKKAV